MREFLARKGCVTAGECVPTCVVKVVGALDLRAALGDGLGGLEVGHLHLHRLAQRAARADDDVARLQVQVDLEMSVRGDEKEEADVEKEDSRGLAQVLQFCFANKRRIMRPHTRDARLGIILGGRDIRCPPREGRGRGP